jgi:hypothetical protein
VYGVPLNHESKTGDFLFVVVQTVSRANTVDMIASPMSLVPFLVVTELHGAEPFLRRFLNAQLVKKFAAFYGT